MSQLSEESAQTEFSQAENLIEIMTIVMCTGFRFDPDRIDD